MNNNYTKFYVDWTTPKGKYIQNDLVIIDFIGILNKWENSYKDNSFYLHLRTIERLMYGKNGIVLVTKEDMI